jgi:hypothetical protein
LTGAETRFSRRAFHSAHSLVSEKCVPSHDPPADPADLPHDVGPRGLPYVVGEFRQGLTPLPRNDRRRPPVKRKFCTRMLPGYDTFVPAAAAQAALPDAEKLSLWSGQAPLGDGRFETACASITLHRPALEKANGVALVFCPGGGYRGLVVNPEGHGIVTWLNQHGITGIVLEYLVRNVKRIQPLDTFDCRCAVALHRPSVVDRRMAEQHGIIMVVHGEIERQLQFRHRLQRHRWPVSKRPVTISVGLFREHQQGLRPCLRGLIRSASLMIATFQPEPPRGVIHSRSFFKVR